MQPNAALYSRRDVAASNGLVIGLDNGAPFVEVTNAGTVQRSGAGAPIAPGTWHNLAVVAKLSDRITVLTRGEILAEGDYETVSSNPDVRRAYLGEGHA